MVKNGGCCSIVWLAVSQPFGLTSGSRVHLYPHYPMALLLAPSRAAE